ncbi:Sugar diacid utilization regulator [Nonomuraea solani]|uniref:Sugar diacid utilization regulator n=1 Tax=Nonomuraea solani TaxID=1144553 RepID=A0A1H5T2W6_9ACTN|nr:helix-turn-helix domain-containing protein [Nonomuraea solani]SEF57232.1 Sugar diacid utilization regulator [Nonomuraea solani]
MQGLLLRLSTLDADAESAVRVIAYFDSLVRGHVSVPVLLKATARLTQCPVGLFDAATGRRTRTSPGGALDTPASAPASVRELSSGLGSVWMEREGPAHGLDEIVLERYAVAAEVTLERAAALTRTGRDPALVELVLSAETGEAERARALRLLGFDPATPLQALAIALPDTEPPNRGLPDRGLPDRGLPDQGLAAGLRMMGHHVRAATIGDTQAVLVATTLPELPDGARIGIGPELPGARAAESWTGARTALRFTGPHDRVMRWSDLGALALFADLPEAAIAGLADVQAMAGLGEESLLAVRALCLAGSVRGAAVALHLHHSSLAGRIARAESVLGFSLADPAGRTRAHLALALTRLQANPPVRGRAPA